MHVSSTYDTFDSACACVRMPLCVCVYLHTHGHIHTHTHSVVLHVHTSVTCLYDMHYRERDAHAPCIYKSAHIHARLVRMQGVRSGSVVAREGNQRGCKLEAGADRVGESVTERIIISYNSYPWDI
jgi:hypothetical protein